MTTSVASFKRVNVWLLWSFAGVVLLHLLACGASPGATGGKRGPGGSTPTDPPFTFVDRDDAGRLIAGHDDAGNPIPVFDDAGRFNPAVATFGAIAVDKRDETTYVVQGFPTRAILKEMDGGAVFQDPFTVKTLWALRPDEASAREVARLDLATSTGVAFPLGGVLVSSTRSDAASSRCTGRLALYDMGARRVLRQRDDSPCFGVGAMSASLRWVLATSRDGDTTSISVVDGTTLDAARTTVVPSDHPMDAAWLNLRDAFVALTSSMEGQAYQARVALWDLSAVPSGGLLRERAWRERPALSVQIPDVSWGVGVPFTVRVSPDDRYAVVSANRALPGESLPSLDENPRLFVIDLRTSALRAVNDAVGPVGFTPDGSTIVAFHRARDARYSATDFDGGQAPTSTTLLFFDVEALTRAELPLPIEGLPLFYVTRSGHRVVITRNDRPGDLLLFDTQMRRLVRVAEDAPPISNFVMRQDGRELWMLGAGLRRLEVTGGTLEAIDLGWSSSQINILPRADLLVLDRRGENALSFWSPATRATTRTVTLPVPDRR